jgi:hypothetical protein
MQLFEPGSASLCVSFPGLSWTGWRALTCADSFPSVAGSYLGPISFPDEAAIELSALHLCYHLVSGIESPSGISSATEQAS